MADELSFEEFRAIELRNRSKKKTGAKGSQSVAEDVAEDPPADGAGRAQRKPRAARGGVLAKLGVFLEMHEMQAAVCILLLLDTYCAFYISTGVFSDQTSIMFEIWHRGLRSFSTFSLFFFVIEISANILAFNVNIVGHFGYLVDVMVVAWQVYLETEGAPKAYKLMNLFRLWRVLRLFFSMLDIERAAHDETKEVLSSTMKELDDAKEKLRLVEDDIEREKEARGAVEDMLQNYKEEVDTLNEALKIAAMDIAEVAEAEDDFFSSDEDDDDVTADKFGDESSSATGAAVGEERDAVKNKEELYRLAMSGSAASTQKSSTFVIRDDGTFEHK